MEIVPLSKETLAQAIGLTLKVFRESKPGDFDYPPKWLKFSIENYGNEHGYGYSLGYWVAG